jgi:3',5'-cyclic AMP phosphodiesterase CpdA
MPYNESGSTSNLYYSFEVASTHIIMLGSYTDFDEHSKQYKWLQSDLVKIDRKSTPWVIVLLHAPWYNTNEAHEGEGEKMRQAMEALLYEARVDLVFSGHVHAYERFVCHVNIDHFFTRKIINFNENLKTKMKKFISNYAARVQI